MEYKLFCKPAAEMVPGQILFTGRITGTDSVISFRSLNLSTDLDLIFDWVNRAYSKRFWQLNGSKKRVEMTYGMTLQNPGTHSFIGLLDNRPVCQIDIYRLSVNELRREVPDYKPNDCDFIY